jgi:PilZ domain
MSADNRRARRIAVNAAAVVESIGQPSVDLHPNLATVYSRVGADATSVGTRFPGVVRDLSTNGAFIAGEALPLLSRVATRFDVPGVGPIEVIGWVLWRRSADCEVPGAGGETLPLPRGIGILFEAIPLEARNAIARLVAAAR